MMNLTWIEFLLRTIPESFVIIWGIIVISKQSISKCKYVICSISIATITFLVSYLPIHLGLHIIINNVITVCLMVIVGISLIKAIYSTILITLLLLVGELINTILLNLFNVAMPFKNSFFKCIYGLPSMVFLIFAISVFCLLINRKEGLNDVVD
jgi:uncharacterized membrane protein YozB (DUF420 family)